MTTMTVDKNAKSRLERLKNLVDKNKTGTPEAKKYFHQRVFLCDVSISMCGKPLIDAKAVMEKFAEKGDGCYVFGSDVFYVSLRMLKAKPLQAMGNTAMLPAIQKAVKEVKGLVELLIITDGEPNEDNEGPGLYNFTIYKDRIIDYVSKINGIVISTVGIGRHVDMTFLKAISDMTGGKSQHIETTEELAGAVALLTHDSGAITM